MSETHNYLKRADKSICRCERHYATTYNVLTVRIADYQIQEDDL